MERANKWRLMGALGKFLHAGAITPEEFARIRFRKILVSRQHNQMGDMMLAIPALRAIRETYPEARIGVVTSTLNRDVLENNPYVDDVFTYDKRSVFSAIRMMREVRREGFDLAIALHTVSFSFTTLMLCVLSGAATRIGSTSLDVGDRLTGTYLNITLPLPDPAELATMNEAEHNLYPLRTVGIVTDNLAPLIVPSAASSEWARSFAQSAWGGECVRLAVHPGAGKIENIWPAERFAAVVNAIGAERRVQVLALQGPRDAEAVERFQRACDFDAAVASGRRIGDIAALMQLADLVICNDTGVMHVSAAAGATTLAVFGLTDPVRWAPRCDGLHIVQSPDGVLSSVTVEMVAREAARVLGLVLPTEGNLER